MPWLNGGDESDVAASGGSGEVAVAYKIACNALETSIADSVVWCCCSGHVVDGIVVVDSGYTGVVNKHVYTAHKPS